MNQIKIDTFFGDKSVRLKVTRAFSGTYQVWINKNYQGLIMQTAEGCIVHFNRDTILQGDDVSIIIDLVEQSLP
jgi:hypothetical protein